MGVTKTFQFWNSTQIGFAALLVACLFAGLFALVSDTTTEAATTLPTKMNFQGRITNNSGTILPNGTYNMRFKIWNAASGGTSQWSEDRLVSASQGVQVTNGQFSVQLGSVTSLPASVFTSNSLYFEIELPTPASATTSSPVWTEGAMTPRNQLATSAYAYNSETLDGLDSAAFGQLDQNNTFTGNNTFNGTLQGGSSLTLGTGAAQGSLVLNDGNGQTGTLRIADIAGNYTYTIPVTTANDTFCLQTLANCGAGGGVSTVGALDGGTANANGAAIVGSTLYLQSASSSNAGLVNTTTQSFAGNKTFTGTVAVSGATTLNENLTVAANKTIQLVGGTTASRPGSPLEGMVYYDTDTKKLQTYSNGKWQADRTDAILVAASNSSQTDKDAADYVADGNTAAAADGDQVQINQALVAAAGKKVVLLSGTYTIDVSVTIPNNTILSGVGEGTLITIPDAFNTSFNAIVNTDTFAATNVSIRDLKLDGNKANQSGTLGMAGIAFTNMGGGSGSTARPGARISNITVSNWYYSGSGSNCAAGMGICLRVNSGNSVIENVTANGNDTGINLEGNGFNVSSNQVHGNTSNGILISGSNFNVSGNNVQGNGSGNNGAGIGTQFTSSNITISANTIGGGSGRSGIGISTNTSNNTVTGNTITSGPQYGIEVLGSSNTIGTNRIIDSGAATTNNGIYVSAADNNTITDNSISDSSATTNNFAINIVNATSDNNTLSGNRLGSGSINDAGTGTIYVNQTDSSGSLINRNQGGFSVGKATAGTTLDIQGAIRNVALSTPTSPTLATSGTAGSTTYGYRVSALDGMGETLASTETTIATGNATLSGTNYINITWPQVGGAVQYKVFRSTSGGTPSSTGLIRTVAGNVLTTTDTGIAASGAVAVSNTTGGVSFAGSMQGGSSLSLGTASVAGTLSISDGSSNTATIAVGNLAGNYTYTIPVTTANDTFCMQTLANCSAGSGVTTVGALDGGTANANGATISGATIYLQSASATFGGLVNTTTQSFAGNKTFGGTLTIGTATNGFIFSSTGLSVVGTARSTSNVMLAPEFAGATFTAITANFNGSLSSDFCSGTGLLNVNTGVCGASDEHNYYSWTTTQAQAQDYGVFVRYRVPSNYDTGSMSNLKLWGRGTTASEVVGVVMYKGATACGTISDAVTTANTWEEATLASPLGSCTVNADDILTFKFTMTATTNNTARLGELSFTYRSKL